MLVWSLFILAIASAIPYTEDWSNHLQTGTFFPYSFYIRYGYNVVYTFPTRWKDANYKCALAITEIYHQWAPRSASSTNHGRFDLYITPTNLQPTRLEIQVSSTNSSSYYVQNLALRYLIVDNDFPYLTLTVWELPNIGSYNSWAPLGPYIANSTAEFHSEDYLIHIINGYSIEELQSNRPTSMQSNCIINMTDYILCYIITPEANLTFQVNYWRVEIIAIHQHKIMEDFNFTWIVGMNITSSCYVQPLPSESNNKNVFFGMKGITRSAVNKKRIQVSMTFDSSLSGTASPNNFIVNLPDSLSQTITFFYAYFNPMTIQCFNQTYWNSDKLLCQMCLAGEFFDNIGCTNCTYHHQHCNQCNSTACLNCSEPYILIGGTCVTCYMMWPQCNECTEDGCTNCTLPYVLNGTNGSRCYTCGQLWPDCSDCNSSLCSNCTDPYLLSGAICSLCSELFSNCSNCSLSECFNCSGDYILKDYICQTCWQLYPNCLTCNQSHCLNCTDNYAIQGSDCITCDKKWQHCLECNQTECFRCVDMYYANGTECFLCSVQWLGCNTCNVSHGCLTCLYPYGISNNTCIENCSLIDQCRTCRVDNWQLFCNKCYPGYIVSDENTCVPDCGDGMVIGDEQCDDNNTRDKDGCSSTCQIQQYFQCSPAIQPSLCILIEMNTTVVCIAKSQDKNQLVLSVDLSPKDLVYYDDADWLNVFQDISHQITPQWATIDKETGRLRVGFAYNQHLQGQSISINSNFSLASSSFNLTAVTLSLPSTTRNNQALYSYSDSTYSIAKVVRYLSYLIAGLSILMLVVGYFGCKLQIIEGIAVIQVTAILLMTVQDMGPTFSGLKILSISLGITPIFHDSYYYQSSTVPIHLNTILQSNDFISLVNIFLAVLVVPMLVALVLKILASTKYKQNYRMDRAWRYVFGTYTFYGLLFLAYGAIASLALNIRYFQTDTSTFIGLAGGAIFLLLFIIWIIGLYKYSVWFGSFKNKFYIFQISKYIYIFSSIERILTAILVICISPGLIAAAVISGIFIVDIIFLVVKKPYGFGQWKRPLMNKIIAAVISLLYVGASVTNADSGINQLIPLAILVLLLLVIVVSVIGSIMQLKERYKDQEKDGVPDAPPLTVEQAHRLLMKDFQMKMMPSMIEKLPLRKPVQHQQVDLNRWRWQQYPILGVSDMAMRTKLKKQVQRMKKTQSQQDVSAEAQFLKKGGKISIKQINNRTSQDIYDEL